MMCGPHVQVHKAADWDHNNSTPQVCRKIFKVFKKHTGHSHSLQIKKKVLSVHAVHLAVLPPPSLTGLPLVYYIVYNDTFLKHCVTTFNLIPQYVTVPLRLCNTVFLYKCCFLLFTTKLHFCFQILLFICSEMTELNIHMQKQHTA